MLKKPESVIEVEPYFRIDKARNLQLIKVNRQIKINKVLTIVAGFLEFGMIMMLVFSPFVISAFNYVFIMTLIALLLTRVLFGIYRDCKLKEEKERFKRFFLY